MELINKKTTIILLILIIGIILAFPILVIVKESILLALVDLKLFLNKNILIYLSTTIQLIFFTSVFSLILAVIPAYILSFYNLKNKKIIDVLLILPLSIPSYIMAFIYSDILGYGGFLQNMININFSNTFNFDVMSIKWLSVFLSLSLYPYVYATSRISFSLIGSTYINLSQSLSASWFTIFRKVILPLSLSGIFSGLVLVIMEVLNEYGAVNYFGVKTLSVAIFQYWFSLDNKEFAIFLSFLLLTLVFFFVFIASFLKKSDDKIKYHTKYSENKLADFKSRIGKLCSLFLIYIPFIFGFLIPLFFISNNVYNNFNNYNFLDLFTLTFNTLKLAIITSIIIVTLSFYIINVKRVMNIRFINLLIKIITTGYAVPGAVIGLSLMIILRYLGSDFSFLMGTIYLLIYAYVFRFISVAIFPLQTSINRQPLEYDALGRSLGLSSFKLFSRVTFPLNKLAILSAFTLVTIDIIKELPVTLILRPFNFETLSTMTYEYASEEMLAYSSLYSLTLIILCSSMLVFATLILKRKYVFKS